MYRNLLASLRHNARRVPGRPRLWLAAALAVPVIPLIALAPASPALALGNGLAPTPPMGWNDWNTFGCNVSEPLVGADRRLVCSGLQAAGYQYVNIDDCWMSTSRDASGNLVAGPGQVPQRHRRPSPTTSTRKGLKFGIYEDAGTTTCAGYPGSLRATSSRTPTCSPPGASTTSSTTGATSRSAASPASRTSRSPRRSTRGCATRWPPPAARSCSACATAGIRVSGPGPGPRQWPTSGALPPTSSRISPACCPTSTPTWGWLPPPVPGHWNDPDMLEIGNGMSATENQSQFTLWAEMAAPLIAGTNLASASSATLSILTSKAVIAVDQDPLGKQGTEVSSASGLDVLAKPLADGDVSVALFNETGSTATISTTAAAIGKTGSSSYTLTNLWTGATATTTGTISASVPAHGTVMFQVAGGSSSTSPIRRDPRRGGGQVPGCAELGPGQRHPGGHLDLRRRQQPDLDVHLLGASSPSTAGRNAWTPTTTRPPRARRSRSGTATAEPTSSGRSTPTAPSPACNPGCAWM